MPDLRIGALQWAVGGYCMALGALMLVAPHHFHASVNAPLQPYLPGWGTIFLLAGAALVGISVFAPHSRSQPLGRLCLFALHFPAAAALLLAGGVIVSGIWAAVVHHAVLGLGTAVAPLLSHAREHRAGASGDLLALLLGVSTSLNGLVILALPDQFAASTYGPARSALPWFGAVFLSGGLGLAATQLRAPVPLATHRAAHLMTAGAFFAYLAAGPLPTRDWAGLAFYGGFGMVLALLPWLGPRLRRLDPASLRVQLVLATAAAAVLPLVVVLAVDTYRDERQTIAQALAQQEVLAVAFAQEVASYIDLHRAAVAALATELDLARMGPDAQQALLRASCGAYPDVLACSTFDADGTAIARSDGHPVRPIAGSQAYERARRANEPSLEIVVLPAVERPVLMFGAPIRAPDGRFAGLAKMVVQSERLAALLDRARTTAGVETYLVDDRGRTITHPDATLVGSSVELSTVPPVAALLAGGAASGALSYPAWSGERLAGYARVLDLGWAVVAERPRAAVLANVEAGRDLDFGLLLLLMGVAAVLGSRLADSLGTPLGALARAMDQLVAGTFSAPLPRSRTAEVERLAVAFGEARARLAAQAVERERAEELERLREEWTSVIAHDLRQPATVITGYAGLLARLAQQHLAVPQEQKAVEHILASARQLDRMIADLLDVSRLEAGRLTLERRPVDLVVLVREVVERTAVMVQGCPLRVEAAEDLPPVEVDPGRIEQVLGNLLSNAAKYGAPKTEIRVAVERRAEGVEVAVSNRGDGIAPEELPHLFTRFYRARQARAGTVHGLGLGLYISHGLVEAHGGRLWAESDPGQITTFRFVLPAAATDQAGRLPSDP
ncbi:MAG: sensor histidine kinase [Chloroflexi bacterium]|nr:sensor histidine kinase [Chloroflexota bacterium]